MFRYFTAFNLFLIYKNIKIRQYECFPKILHMNSWLQFASKYSK